MQRLSQDEGAEELDNCLMFQVINTKQSFTEVHNSQPPSACTLSILFHYMMTARQLQPVCIQSIARQLQQRGVKEAKRAMAAVGTSGGANAGGADGGAGGADGGAGGADGGAGAAADGAEHDDTIDSATQFDENDDTVSFACECDGHEDVCTFCDCYENHD